MKPEELLRRRAAERARLRPEYLGWILARYEEIEGVDELKLRKQLDVSPEQWNSLHLCLRPRPKYFLKDVSAIAKDCQVSRDVLAMVVRRVDAVEVLRPTQVDPDEIYVERPERTQANPEGAGSLMAARTRKKRPAERDNEKGGSHGS
jgi:hypothetical protein